MSESYIIENGCAESLHAGLQAPPELLAAARAGPGDSSQRLRHAAELFERASAQVPPQLAYGRPFYNLFLQWSVIQ